MAIEYFQQNPDVAAAYAENSYGLTPEQFAATHYANFGAQEGREAPAPAPTISDYTGQEYSADTLKTLASDIYGSFNPAQLSGGVFSTSNESVGFSPEELKATYGLNDLNTAEQVAFDIARNLMQKGVTNLSDIGIQQQTQNINIVPTSIDAQGNVLGGFYNLINEDGTPGAYRALQPEDLAKLQPKVVQTEEGPVTQYTLPSVTTGYKVATPSGFGATVDLTNGTSIPLGATYTGPGGTYYYLTIDPATGKPTFTTQGGSTSDKGDILGALGLASAFFGVPGMLGSALGASGSTAAALGGALMGGGTAALTGNNILKGALLGGAGGYVSDLIGSQFGGGAGVESLDDAARAALEAGDLYASTGTLTAADLAAQLGVSLEDAANILRSTGGFLNQASVDQLMEQYGQEALKAADSYEQAGTLTAQDLANQLGIPVEEVAKILPAGTILADGTVAASAASSGAASTTPAAAAPAAPATPATPAAPGTPTPGITDIAKGLLTPSNVSTLLKLLAAAGATKAVTAGGGGGTAAVGALPTQGIPQNTPGYFQAVQQSYNQFMPAAPRDVAGPLEQWYKTKYGS